MPAKKTPLSPKKATAVKTSDTEETKSTPVTKRAATKRKLVNETTEQQTKEADSKKGTIQIHIRKILLHSKCSKNRISL